MVFSPTVWPADLQQALNEFIDLRRGNWERFKWQIPALPVVDALPPRDEEIARLKRELQIEREWRERLAARVEELQRKLLPVSPPHPGVALARAISKTTGA